MFDYAQSFEEFAGSVKPIDLALYAGIGLIVWVLFKEKLKPIGGLLSPFVDKVKNTLSPLTSVSPQLNIVKKEDVFFKLVQSWKQTRDLAVQSGCTEAVKVADQMFPFLSPQTCLKDEK